MYIDRKMGEREREGGEAAIGKGGRARGRGEKGEGKRDTDILWGGTVERLLAREGKRKKEKVKQNMNRKI